MFCFVEKGGPFISGGEGRGLGSGGKSWISAVGL